MIGKFLRRFLGGNKPASSPLVKIPAARHGIVRERISPCALKTVTTLQQAGYVAFIVGGAVRDLLLNQQPKDFDVATNATPEQVNAVFRRSRIIGRRFRLVHVLCGAETIEVSTFRGSQEHEDRRTDDSGRLLRDNVFGSQEHDALRRDFTINALYYDPTSGEVWDYCNGVADLQARQLVMIGDPALRYREDPVRMVRAARLAGKLGLEIETNTRNAIPPLAPLLQSVPASRMFDEMLKLLLSGQAHACVHRLRQEGLHHGFLPMLDTILEQPLGQRFVDIALQRTDERIQQNKPVSPAFLLAALLWHEVQLAWKNAINAGERPHPALFDAMDQVLERQEEKLAIPKRYGSTIKEIWGMQPRFEQRSGAKPYRLLEHPRFRAAYDFLLLRCESGELDAELGTWWERFQDAGDSEREEMLQPETGPRKRKRRRRRAGDAAAAPTTEGD